MGVVIIESLKKDHAFAQLAIMILLAGAGFGMAGVVAILFYHWLALQRTAVDSADKHGISVVQSSRLGGVAIVLTTLGLILSIILLHPGSIYSDPFYSPDASRRFGLPIVVFCTMLGFVEDVKPDYLSPRLRLLLKFIAIGLFVYLAPTIVPQSLGIAPIDYLLANAFVGWALTTIFLVGFINAVNMSDGANGLIPGIVFCSVMIFYIETNRPLDGVLAASCGLFFIYNLITGRLFLGDTGTYGLGMLLALYGLSFFVRGELSLGFLAALFAYPCIDFLVSIVRRLHEGRSPFSPDNDHLHNRLHRQFQKCFESPLVANSATGLSITLATSGVVLMGFLQQWWPVTSNDWAWIFVGEVILYAVIYYATGLGRPSAQYAEPI